MFDSSLPYHLVQIRKNKFVTSETYIREYIFKFHLHNTKGCIKYIASIKEYPEGLLTMDYYPKISLTPKVYSLDSIQDLRYRMLTKQNSFGRIGGTLMDIMVMFQNRYNLRIWGFLAANLIQEDSNDNNKRYKTYSEILRRSFQDDYKVFGNQKNSVIFVIPKTLSKSTEGIIKRYEEVFAETN